MIQWGKRLLRLALGLAASMAISQTARGEDTKTVCLAAHVEGQKLRHAGEFLVAKARFRACSEEVCPAVLRDECAGWLSEVDAAQPTLIVTVRDERGNDLSDVTVHVDGARVADRITGLALPVDPGKRTLRLATSQGKERILELVVHEGEKARRIDAVIPLGPSPDGPPAPETTDHEKPSVLAYALGATGLISLGVFAVLGVSVNGRFTDLRTSCAQAPGCTSDDIHRVRRDAVIADVALAVSVVSLGAAAVLLLTGSTQKPASTTAASFGSF